jgi:hypothetical protein
LRTDVRRALLFGALLVVAAGAAGCHRDMRDQPKYKPFEASDFFGDRRSVRPVVEGTVARGQLRADSLLYTGKMNGQPADLFPFTVTREVVLRGRDRYDIFCSPCHDYTGAGRGMIALRGHRLPPSFHEPRLKDAAAGYFFGVITNGFGVMYDYAAQISPEDRWAIVAYVRTLQAAGNATIDDVPQAERAGLDRPAGADGAAPRGSGGGH